jgi:hydroxymethylpyrimidine pyrophosphatase-like HAD family hydrolase
MTPVYLFDVDRTLTEARQPISPGMLEALRGLQTRGVVGIVSGSDEKKIREQVGSYFEEADWTFSENGLRTFRKGKLHE